MLRRAAPEGKRRGRQERKAAATGRSGTIMGGLERAAEGAYGGACPKYEQLSRAAVGARAG